MDEEECNYRSPIGQIIKRMTIMCKKPQFDNELGNALDTFRKTLASQQKYLNNGIFQTNFAEAALFLQSSAEVYGKRVDLLWTEILEFHTRLIEYDCEHAKQKGLKMNEEDITRLEERRNRYKRKKNFKLLRAQIDITHNILYDKQNVETEVPFEFDDKVYQAWRRIEYEAQDLNKYPDIVYKQKLKEYRMTNYPICPGIDYIIEDFEDGEFNTRYSRLPNWHHIYHLFEYNDEGLLPDNQQKCIAKLRLCMYRRLQFMYERNIPYSTPFYQYKEEYLAFREKFFEEEGKKWQNMPLETLDDLGRQYEYLAKMAQEQQKNNNDLHRITPVPKLIHKDEIIYCSDESNDEDKTSNSIDKILEGSDDDGLFELSFDCSDISKSDLFVRLEKLSSDIINNKLRQDSGFYDFDDEIDGKEVATTDGKEDATTDGKENATTNGKVDATTDGKEDAITDVRIGDPLNPDNNVVTETQETDNCQNSATADNPSIMESTNENNENTNKNDENQIPVNTDDNFDTRSVLSDHDYCSTPIPLSEHNGNSQKTMNEKSLSTIPENEMLPFSNKIQIIPRASKIKLPKEPKIVDKENKEPRLLGKRRKLSRKQIEKLAKSLIPPTKIMKFERFFSLNYQPQLGEGEIQPVEYESDDPDIDEPDIPDELPVVNDQVHDNDDTRSIRSEHSYCRIPEEIPKDVANDSGIADLADLFDEDEYADLVRMTEMSQTVQEKRPAPTSEETPVIENEECRRRLEDLRRQREENEAEINDPAFREKWKDEIERRELKARVEEWKQTITPILKNLQERDFDIHEYGSNIMNGMEVNETKSFSSIVEGKSSAEVVRYFISSLQLANTNNIEICGVKPGELSNDTYNVKLLKRDRYHEHLTEYEAPSKETFRERLKRMRSKNKNQDSDSDDEPLSKIVKPDKKPLQVQNKSTSSISISKYKHNSVRLSNKVQRTNNSSATNGFLETQNSVQPVMSNINQVAKNKVTTANPLKGKTIIRLPVRQELVALHSEPSTSQHIHTTVSDRDSGFMSESMTSSVSFEQESPTQQPTTFLTSPSEECFQETLLQRQHPISWLQSTPHSSTSFRCMSVNIPRTINFE